ncbi:hypothetical protein [Halodesulfovibrio sp. MK-HDV]|uniref:hypothetical protein n=1 Tax=Halodesulfovibrio sp. MK-HDV TaxID=2599925 RepID=UPI0013689435|nr:hypothetical protein [Halodesulfovibrio sp. MK-HDV]KAF1077654.1 hypothetical protein MKHDV_00110 [Halodesulfovibrio sp. MK-HDV]
MAGRKTSYKKSYVAQAREACAMGGFSNAKLGRLFGVTKNTIWKWRKKYPDFDAACKQGFEDFAIDEARGSLMKLVKGFSFTEVTKEAVTNKLTGQTLMLETKRVRKHVQPSVNAVKIVMDRVDAEQATQQTSGELSDLIAEIDGVTRSLTPTERGLLPEDGDAACPA